MESATLVIIKPDGLVKSLTGNILTKLSDSHLVIIAAKVKTTPDASGEVTFTGQCQR